jgi:hypothetical protein
MGGFGLLVRRLCVSGSGDSSECHRSSVIGHRASGIGHRVVTGYRLPVNRYLIPETGKAAGSECAGLVPVACGVVSLHTVPDISRGGARNYGARVLPCRSSYLLPLTSYLLPLTSYLLLNKEIHHHIHILVLEIMTMKKVPSRMPVELSDHVDRLAGEYENGVLPAGLPGKDLVAAARA